MAAGQGLVGLQLADASWQVPAGGAWLSFHHLPHLHAMIQCMKRPDCSLSPPLSPCHFLPPTYPPRCRNSVHEASGRH